MTKHVRRRRIIWNNSNTKLKWVSGHSVSMSHKWTEQNTSTHAHGHMRASSVDKSWHDSSDPVSITVPGPAFSECKDQVGKNANAYHVYVWSLISGHAQIQMNSDVFRKQFGRQIPCWTASNCVSKVGGGYLRLRVSYSHRAPLGTLRCPA